MEPPWNGGTKVCSSGPGHVIKMAAVAMPIYGKKHYRYFSLESKGR